MARNKYRAMAMGKRALSLTLATSLSISAVAGVGATEISVENTDIVDSVEEEVVIEEESADDLLHTLEEKMTYEDVVALKDTLSDREIIEMKTTLDGEVLGWFLEIFADEIDAIENPEEEVEENEEVENEVEQDEEIEDEVEDLENEEDAEVETDIKDVVLDDIIEAVETKLTYEELVELKEVVTYREILLMKEHFHGETLEWFLEIFEDEISLAETAKENGEDLEVGLPKVDEFGGGSEGENLLETETIEKVELTEEVEITEEVEVSEVMLMSEDGVMMMSSHIAPIEVGGFAHLSEGIYVVPVGIKNISNTSIQEVANDAINGSEAILVVDGSGNGKISFGMQGFIRSGFGSTLNQQLIAQESYISDFGYFVEESGEYVFSDTGVTVNNFGQTEVVEISNLDNSVNGMYINYIQRNIDNEAIPAINAYLDFDYDNAVKYVEVGGVNLRPGASHDVTVSLSGTSNALDGTTGTLTISEDGLETSVVIKLKEYYSGITKYWISNISTANVTILSGSTSEPTEIEMPIAIDSTNVSFVHDIKKYIFSTSTDKKDQTSTITITSYGTGSSDQGQAGQLPEPIPEFTEEELARRFTFGDDRRMVSPGTYDVTVRLDHATKTDGSLSSYDDFLLRNAQLMVDADGNGRLITDWQDANMMSLDGYLINFSYYPDYTDTKTKVSAEVLEYDGVKPRIVRFDYPSPNTDNFHIEAQSQAGWYTSYHDAKLVIEYTDAFGEEYDANTVTLRPGELPWGGDSIAPEITIDGYANNATVKLEMGDGIDSWSTPNATAEDNVDGIVDTHIFYASFDSDGEKIADLDDETAVKSYLNQDVGNIVRVYYAAQDLSGNSTLTYLELISTKAVSDGSYADVTKDGIYSVPVKLLQENKEEESMGDAAFDDFRNVTVTTKNGKYFVEVEVGTVTLGVTSGITNVTAVDSTIQNLQETETTTLSDGTVYTSKFTFETDTLVDNYMINFDIAGLGMNHDARLNLDWSKALNFGESAPADITEVGTFEVPVAMYKENSTTDLSMGDPALGKITNVYNMGDYYIFEGEMDIMEEFGLVMGVEGLYSIDSDIIDMTYETSDFSDKVTSGKTDCVTKFVFTTKVIKDFYEIDMDLAGHNNTSARLGFDWSELEKTSNDTSNAPSITAPEAGADITKVGTFEVPVDMYKENSTTDLSMGAGALNKITNVYNMGDYYVFEGEMTYMTLGSNKYGAESIISRDDDIINMTYTTKADDSMSSENKLYVDKFVFTTTVIKDFYEIDMDIYNHNTTEARFGFDWSELEKISDNTANVPSHEAPADTEAPVITAVGYRDGDTIEVQQSKIETMFIPSITVADNKDVGIVPTEVYVNDKGETLTSFIEAKAYIAELVGRSFTVTYTATDKAGNSSSFSLTYTSVEDIVHDNGSMMYSVPVKLMKEDNSEESMGDAAFNNNRNVIVTERDGQYTVEVNIGTVTFGGVLTSGVSNIKSVDGKINITEQVYNSITVDGVDTEYVSKFTFTTNEMLDDYMINFDIAGMNMNHNARLNLDWDNKVELGSAANIYYTFGSQNKMFYTGNHFVNIKVSDTDGNNSMLTNSIAVNNNVLAVANDGTGEITLKISDVNVGGANYTPSSFYYYESNGIDPTTLKKAETLSNGYAKFKIANPKTDGLYIYVGLDDDKLTTSTYIEIDYANSLTAEEYDKSAVTDRVVPKEETSGSYEEGYNKGLLVGLNSNNNSSSNSGSSDGGTTGGGSSSSDILDDIKSNGVFEVPAYLYHESKNEYSMGDDAFKNNRTTTIINDNGEYTFDINISTVNYSGLVGGISTITSSDGKIYDIQQEYSVDSNGKNYVSRLFFKTKTIQDSYDVDFYIPVMGMDVSARLTFDWNNLKQTSSSVNIQYIYVETASTSSSTEETTKTESDTMVDLSELTEEELAELIASVSDMAIAPDDITVNGQYLVPVNLMHESNDQVSMGDPAFAQNRNAHVVTKDGNYTVTIYPSTITMGDLTSGIGTLINTDGKMKGLNILEYSKLATGEDYITGLQFTTNRLDNFYGINITVPNSPMGVTGARLSFNWDKAVSTNKPLENGAPITIEEVTQLAELGNDLVVENGKLKMTFDSLALKSINEQANGKELVITIEEIEDEEIFTDEQKEVIGSQKSYYLQVMAGDEEITDFGDGKVTVELYHFLERNKQIEGITMWYVGADGEIEEFVSEYDDYDRLIRFETNHFSVYSVHYDENYTVATSNGSSLSGTVNVADENKVSELPFEDVSVDDWFYNAIKFTYDNNIFAGTSETTFSPQDNITRASLITLLYRLAGSPDVSGRNQFTDVLSDQYYSKAILWAVKNNISSGYSNGTFGINDIVTREQMVTIVYNYGKYIGMDTTTNVSLDGFADRSDVADYAVVTFEWAIANGIVSGDGDTLSPKGNTKRSEIATVLMNLSDK